MTERYAAFVRNVMIGREGLHRTVLLEMFIEAGAEDPRSYISTGNVTFSASAGDLDGLVRAVEAKLAAVIGRGEEVFVRPIEYLRELEAADPFSEAPFSDAVERTVSFTRKPVDRAALHLPVRSRRGDVAVFKSTDREVFAVSRLVDGRTSGTGGLVAKLVGERLTTRSWTTVQRVTKHPQ